jgi:hypothetical protein
VEEEGSNKERTKQTRVLMCFVPPFLKNLERPHQTMTTFLQSKWGEVTAAHHCHEKALILIVGDHVMDKGSYG